MNVLKVTIDPDEDKGNVHEITIEGMTTGKIIALKVLLELAEKYYNLSTIQREVLEGFLKGIKNWDDEREKWEREKIEDEFHQLVITLREADPSIRERAINEVVENPKGFIRRVPTNPPTKEGKT